MDCGAHQWIDGNSLRCPGDYTLLCSGAFRFAIRDLKGSQIEFPVIIDPSAHTPKIEVLLWPRTYWPNTKQLFQPGEWEKIANTIKDGLFARGFIVDLKLMDDPTNKQFYSPTLQLMDAILSTEGGQILNRLSVNPELTDLERNRIWGEALFQFISANKGE